MPLFFVWISNHTDQSDNDVLKVQAKTKKEAKTWGEEYCMGRGNYSFSRVMTRAEFKKYDPDWHALLWGVKPRNV